MGMALASGSIDDFRRAVHRRMRHLAMEFNEQEFVMPVALCIVVPAEHGGDATAKELIQRFNLLDWESRNVLDFYFLGWGKPLAGGDLEFRQGDYMSCRNALRNAGLGRFGLNADVILVDAQYVNNNIFLNFSEAIRIDLSVALKEGKFATLGDFLASLIEAAERVKSDQVAGAEQRVVFQMSDRLGLAISRKSLLDYFLETWGKIIGAAKIEAIVTKNLAPRMNLQNLDSRPESASTSQ